MPKDTGKKLADMLYGQPFDVPTPENLRLGQKLIEQQVREKAARDAKLTPLDKAKAAYEAAKMMGSAAVAGLGSIPTRIVYGPEAAEKYVTSRISIPETEKGMDYVQNVGDFLEQLETKYKLPPIMPEAMALQHLTGPATKQAARAAKQKVMQAGKAGERYAERKVPQIMERGGAGADILSGLAQGSRSQVIKPKGGNWLGGNFAGYIDPSIARLKPYGGLDETLERAKKSLAAMEDKAESFNPKDIQAQRNIVADLEAKVAVENWVTRNLGNYVKKQMGTPEDPVRALHEQGITHLGGSIDDLDLVADQSLRQRRAEAGFPAEGMGQSEMARKYENLTDDAISSMTAGDVQKSSKALSDAQQAERAVLDYQPILNQKFVDHLKSKGLSESEIGTLSYKTPLRQKAYTIGDEKYGQLEEDFYLKNKSLDRNALGAAQTNPWIEKLAPETELYSGYVSDLGFDHVVDVLKQDVQSGRIRPEQLNKVSMEQAVRRTYEYDQEMAKRMREAALKQTEGFPTYKEYPEGYRWIELKVPDRPLPEGYTLGGGNDKFVFDPSGKDVPNPNYKALEDALKYEGDTMGHCVGGYCPDVMEGRSRIFSLRDAKGEPHVTVEVQPDRLTNVSTLDKYVGKDRAIQIYDEYNAARRQGKAQSFEDYALNQPDVSQAYKEKGPTESIVQIKGKQNRAPKEEYLPFVQDFVRSGQWSGVGDIQNTGLIRKSDLIDKFSPDELDAVGVGEYLTKGEHDDLLLKALNARSPGLTDELGLTTPPADGMAHGGRVHISDNPDVMQLELAGGGLVKGLAKAVGKAASKEKELALPPVLPRAPAKTKEEIRPYAQRMAQQMTGEFYRPNPKKSENVAGKSFSQFKMEKGLEHDIRPTSEVVEPEVADIEKQLGMLKIGISGDTTIADKILHRAGPYELFDPSPQHGGPRYGLGGEGAWASNNPIASTVQKRINELSEAYGAPPLGQYMAMGPQGSNFAQHFADANLQAIDISAMTKGQIEQINRLIREGSEKSGPRPSFPGIEDKGSAYLHFAIDPELRKHFNDLMQKTSVTEKLNLPDGRIILHAITEPELRDKEILNTGFSQMRLRSAFDPENLEASAHPTYSHVIPHEEGSALTRTKYLVPGELEFSDVLDYAKQHYRPRDMTRVFQTSTPRQIVDPQHIDEMKMYEELMKEYTGKKKGGAVSYAEGGEITADDLILEERKL